MMAGIGMKNCITIPCDLSGRILIPALETSISNALKQGQKPFYLCSLAGTTVMGGFDDF